MVEGDFIGTDVTGRTAFDGLSNPLGNGNGVEIDLGATANTVGGLTAGARNIISGNLNDGVEISSNGTSGNVVEGNFIGTDKTGTTTYSDPGRPLGNVVDGVEIDSGASDNTVGGIVAGAGNLISGNASYGVEVTGSGTSGNDWQGMTLAPIRPERQRLTPAAIRSATLSRAWQWTAVPREIPSAELRPALAISSRGTRLDGVVFSRHWHDR